MISLLLFTALTTGYVTVDPGDVKPLSGEPVVQPKSKDKTCNSGEVLFCVGTTCYCTPYGEATPRR